MGVDRRFREHGQQEAANGFMVAIAAARMHFNVINQFMRALLRQYQPLREVERDVLEGTSATTAKTCIQQGRRHDQRPRADDQPLNAICLSGSAQMISPWRQIIVTISHWARSLISNIRPPHEFTFVEVLLISQQTNSPNVQVVDEGDVQHYGRRRRPSYARVAQQRRLNSGLPHHQISLDATRQIVECTDIAIARVLKLIPSHTIESLIFFMEPTQR